MDMNNKFGKCCRCPALMEDARHTTTYAPRRVYNTNMMHMMGVCDSNQYRHHLINDGVSLLNAYNRNLDNTMICKDNNETTFYDRPDINAIFDENLEKKLNGDSKINTEYMILRK